MPARCSAGKLSPLLQVFRGIASPEALQSRQIQLQSTRGRPQAALGLLAAELLRRQPLVSLQATLPWRRAGRSAEAMIVTLSHGNGATDAREAAACSVG